MDRVEADDDRRLAEWFREFEQRRWEAQMDEDSAAGKLDFLFEEAESELAQGSPAELRLLRKKPLREPRIGVAEGQFVVPDSFFEPLPEEILKAFRGK